jgi:DNA polymerase III alpha subunit
LDEIRHVIDEDLFISLLYQDIELSRVLVDSAEWIENFTTHSAEFELSYSPSWIVNKDIPLAEYIEECIADWDLPEDYSTFDILSFVLSKCNSDSARDRVNSEWIEFENRGMIIVLRFLKYFVDTLTNQKLIWGVGRGSSTASYILYLLEVHRIDSLEYDLPITDFLK